MDNTGTYKAVNKYTLSLRKSSMTQKVNKLHKMCLLPLLKDILSYEGRLRQYVTTENKLFWGKFLACCFRDLKFEDVCSVGNYLYIGMASEMPTSSNIVSNSVVYDTSSTKLYISNRVTENYFWVAVPHGMSLKEAKNLDFGGDAIPASGFTRINMTINNGSYTLYWLKSRIPFKSTYQIILN